jgi:hypothetical protein
MLFNPSVGCSGYHEAGNAAQFFRKMTIAPDKGKPVAKQGRKAVSVT